MARALVPLLLARGDRVRGLARPGSEGRLPRGCEAVSGDPLDSASWRGRAAGCDTLVHLVGVPRPSPAKAAQFRAVDLVSIREAVAAAQSASIAHVVYVSVAHPAPVMKAYIEVRAAGEEAIRAAGLNATILRPWYVLGPGHRWPALLVPLYWAMERVPRNARAARGAWDWSPCGRWRRRWPRRWGIPLAVCASWKCPRFGGVDELERVRCGSDGGGDGSIRRARAEGSPGRLVSRHLGEGRLLPFRPRAGLAGGAGAGQGRHALPAGVARVCVLLLAGILIFSGSLYALALTGVRALGAVTPLGGVSFIVGWAMLACGLLHRG